MTADVQSIYSTLDAFAALKADGSIVCWGSRDGIEEARSKAAAESQKTDASSICGACQGPPITDIGSTEEQSEQALNVETEPTAPREDSEASNKFPEEFPRHGSATSKIEPKQDSAEQMEMLKKKAEQLSSKVEAELASIDGSSSDDIVKLAAKADELYINVVNDLGGLEAVQLSFLKRVK